MTADREREKSEKWDEMKRTVWERWRGRISTSSGKKKKSPTHTLWDDQL